MKITINPAVYAAIMAQALRAAQREDWLIECSKESDASGHGVAHHVELRFAPYCDRLVSATVFGEPPTTRMLDHARLGWFVKFSELALGSAGVQVPDNW